LKQFTLRGIDATLEARLRSKAKTQGQSLNQTALTLLKNALGLLPTHRTPSHAYHDLDPLAGTWTKDEFQSFQQELKRARTVDAELWQ